MRIVVLCSKRRARHPARKRQQLYRIAEICTSCRWYNLALKAQSYISILPTPFCLHITSSIRRASSQLEEAFSSETAFIAHTQLPGRLLVPFHHRIWHSKSAKQVLVVQVLFGLVREITTACGANDFKPLVNSPSFRFRYSTAPLSMRYFRYAVFFSEATSQTPGS